LSEVEKVEIAEEVHAGQLSRKLGTFANLAITYSGVGAAAGIWSLFSFSLGASGGTMIWGWVIVGLAMGLISLLWAELSARYPYAGAVFQWAAILGGRRAGWWVGWVYLFGLIWVLTSYYFIVQEALVPLAGLSGTQGEVVGISLATLVVATALNASGIEFMGRLTKFGVIAELGVFVLFSILVAIRAPHHQSLAILGHTLGTSHSFHGWLSTFLSGGMFVAIWVLFSFENGGTLGEETIDAHRKAPKAVMGAWAITFVAGLLFIVVILTALPNTKEVTSGTPVQDAIGAALTHTGSQLYLGLILFITVLGSNAYFAGAVRHIFSMARDNALPGSTWLAKTRASNGTPYVAVLAIAIITALPFIASRTFAVLVTGAVGVIYVGYVLMLAVLLYARLRGWPGDRRSEYFSLGRWGLPLTVFGLLYSLAMAVNLLWPRAATNPTKWGMPVAWWLVGAPLAVGVVVYLTKIVHQTSHEGGAAAVPGADDAPVEMVVK
jgi:amino acid transporter